MTAIPTPHDGTWGVSLLNRSTLNKGTAFTEAERGDLRLHGLLPPVIETLDEQLVRAVRGVSTQGRRPRAAHLPPGPAGHE